MDRGYTRNTTSVSHPNVNIRVHVAISDGACHNTQEINRRGGGNQKAIVEERME